MPKDKTTFQNPLSAHLCAAFEASGYTPEQAAKATIEVVTPIINRMAQIELDKLEAPDNEDDCAINRLAEEVEDEHLYQPERIGDAEVEA